MIKADEPCVAFMNRATREELKDIPDNTVVLTELLEDGETVVVPKNEFMQWLLEEE